MRTLRLLKVICQPVFVIDDGVSLIEQVAQPVHVPALEWPHFATGQFAVGFEQLRLQVEGSEPVPDLDNARLADEGKDSF